MQPEYRRGREGVFPAESCRGRCYGGPLASQLLPFELGDGLTPFSLFSSVYFLFLLFFSLQFFFLFLFFSFSCLFPSLLIFLLFLFRSLFPLPLFFVFSCFFLSLLFFLLFLFFLCFSSLPVSFSLSVFIF